MKKVKVIGAGSIGNHLSHAARNLGWSVDLVDVDPAALERTRTQIYPSRYGAFDPAIRLFEASKAPNEAYDLVCIGTPPDTHISLALEALDKSTSALLIEKPLCGPGLEKADELLRLARARSVKVFVGYDHVVGRAAMFATAALADGAVGKALTLDVEFREHWGGIFAAHPWLSGPGDSYLGFTARGGGASGEHSHALNLWQHFALVLKAGRVKKVQATLDRALEGDQDYDKICLMTLETESGLIGRCIQDVVTQPPRKWARIQGSSGAVEWDCGSKPGQDSVNIHVGGKRVLEHTIYKARPDDFITELRHIEAALQPDAPESPILLERGLDTMLVLSAAHLSAHLGRTVAIDYQKGYNCDALSLV